MNMDGWIDGSDRVFDTILFMIKSEGGGLRFFSTSRMDEDTKSSWAGSYKTDVGEMKTG